MKFQKLYSIWLCPLKKVRRSNSQTNDYNLQDDKKCSNKSVSKNHTRSSVFNDSTPLFVLFLKGMGIMAFRIFLSFAIFSNTHSFMNPSLIFWHLVIHLQILHSSSVFIYVIFQSFSTLFNFGLVSFTDLMYLWISVPHFQVSFITLHNCLIWISTVYNTYLRLSLSLTAKDSIFFHSPFFLLSWTTLSERLFQLSSWICHQHNAIYITCH